MERASSPGLMITLSFLTRKNPNRHRGGGFGCCAPPRGAAATALAVCAGAAVLAVGVYYTFFRSTEARGGCGDVDGAVDDEARHGEAGGDGMKAATVTTATGFSSSSSSPSAVAANATISNDRDRGQGQAAISQRAGGDGVEEEVGESLLHRPLSTSVDPTADAVTGGDGVTAGGEAATTVPAPPQSSGSGSDGVCPSLDVANDSSSGSSGRSSSNASTLIGATGTFPKMGRSRVKYRRSSSCSSNSSSRAESRAANRERLDRSIQRHAERITGAAQGNDGSSGSSGSSSSASAVIGATGRLSLKYRRSCSCSSNSSSRAESRAANGERLDQSIQRHAERITGAAARSRRGMSKGWAGGGTTAAPPRTAAAKEKRHEVRGNDEPAPWLTTRIRNGRERAYSICGKSNDAPSFERHVADRAYFSSSSSSPSFAAKVPTHASATGGAAAHCPDSPSRRTPPNPPRLSTSERRGEKVYSTSTMRLENADRSQSTGQESRSGGSSTGSVQKCANGRRTVPFNASSANRISSPSLSSLCDGYGERSGEECSPPMVVALEQHNSVEPLDSPASSAPLPSPRQSLPLESTAAHHMEAVPQRHRKSMESPSRSQAKEQEAKATHTSSHPSNARTSPASTPWADRTEGTTEITQPPTGEEREVSDSNHTRAEPMLHTSKWGENREDLHEAVSKTVVLAGTREKERAPTSRSRRQMLDQRSCHGGRNLKTGSTLPVQFHLQSEERHGKQCRETFGEGKRQEDEELAAIVHCGNNATSVNVGQLISPKPITTKRSDADPAGFREFRLQCDDRHEHHESSVLRAKIEEEELTMTRE